MTHKKKYANGGLTEIPIETDEDYDGSSEKLDSFSKGGKVKRKAAVLAIVAKLAKKPMTGMHEEPDGDEPGNENEDETPSDNDGDSREEGQIAAAEEMIGALKSGDKESFASSLKNFIHLCKEEVEE